MERYRRFFAEKDYEMYFTGCEIAITIDALKKNTNTYKKSDFILEIVLKHPFTYKMHHGRDVVVDSVFFYGRISNLKRDVFISSNDDLRNYANYENLADSPNPSMFLEGKWNIDTDSIYMPYPDFSRAHFKIKEITDFLNKHFNNAFIEKYKNKYNSKIVIK